MLFCLYILLDPFFSVLDELITMDTQVTDIATLGTRPNSMIYVSVAFLALTWTAVTLRVWVRAYMIRSFGWDDGTMVLALVRRSKNRSVS